MGSFSIWHWIIVLVIVLLVFGTKRLTSGSRDVGKAVDEFKKGMRGGDDDKPAARLGGDKTTADSASSSDSARDRDDVAR